MNKKIVIYIIFAAVFYYLLKKYVLKSKYYKYFNKELGFGELFLNKFTNDELKTSYEYLTNYPRKGKVLTYQDNPKFYLKVIAINNKFHIFEGMPLS